ncbi:MAG: pentapeptide repeat-containing protein [Microcoleaceae cyanobacterium]
MNKQHWLDISEYVCLAGSVLGTIATATSGQAIYAAAPLTLALSVGVANRKRLDTLQQQEQKGALIDIQKSFLEDLDRVDGQTAKLQEKLNIQTEEQNKKLESVISPLTNELETLKPVLSKIEALTQQTDKQERIFQEAIAQFKTELQGIESIPTQLQQMIQRLKPLENQQKEILTQRLPWAVSAIEALQDRTSVIAPLESNFENISTNLQTLTNRVENLPQPEFFSNIEAGITSVQKRLDLNPVNLQSAVLTDKDLSGIYLKQAQLTDANLSGVNLGGACLHSADLTDVNLSSANLMGADLAVANLSYADLNNADLSQVDLSFANLSGVDLSSANLTGVNLSFADLTNADLSNANLASANLINANLSGAILSGADLSGANLHDANLSNADLTNTNLSNVNLCGANLWCVDLNDANLNGTLIDRKSKLNAQTQILWESMNHKNNDKNPNGNGKKVTEVNHNGVNLISPNFLSTKANDNVVIQSSSLD